MPVAAPADKRFRRARVTPTRRSRWRVVSWGATIRAAVLLAVLVFVCYRAASMLLIAEALTVTRFDVTGNSRISKGEVIALLEGLRGSNMLTVDLEPWRQTLLGSPWVADASIRRVLPGTVAVALAERRPMGIGRVGDELYLIDDRGGIIDEFGPNYAEIDLPIINGLATARPDEAPSIDKARAGLASRLLLSLQAHPQLAAQVSEIDVSDAADAVVLLTGDTAQVRLGDEQFSERLQSYLDLAPALRERIAAIDYVDLRFDERVYVRPLGSASRPSPVGRRLRLED